MIAIPVGFSSVIVVWWHWVIALLLIPTAFALAWLGQTDRGKPAGVSHQSRPRIRGAAVVGAEDLRAGEEVAPASRRLSTSPHYPCTNRSVPAFRGFLLRMLK
jgi:hypothetical protein